MRYPLLSSFNCELRVSHGRISVTEILRLSLKVVLSKRNISFAVRVR